MNQDVQKIYNDILISQEIIERYKEVQDYEEKDPYGIAFHNLEHVKNVTKIVEQVLTDLGFQEDFIYKAKIACMLHDTGANKGKEDHAYRSYEYAKQYFSKHNISFDGMDLVLDAIHTHSDGFETDNMIALSLVFADKLDIKKTRISKKGADVVGPRQYTHINDIQLHVTNGVLEIYFITDGNMDFEEVNEYYFTKKVFKAIRAFADKLDLEYKVFLDGEVWIMEDKSIRKINGSLKN